MVKIIYFKKPNTWDSVTVIIYFLLTLFIYFADFSGKVDWLFGYTFGTHLFIYLFNYKSLRNFGIWLIWLGFSLLHIYLYFHFVDQPELQLFGVSTANGLRFTWVLLLLFQLLRFISLKIKGQELVSLSRRKVDLWDKRPIATLDLILFFVYFAIMMVLNFMS